MDEALQRIAKGQDNINEFDHNHHGLEACVGKHVLILDHAKFIRN